MRTSLLLALAVLALGAVAAVVVLGRGSEEPASEHPLAVPEAPRTVLVSASMPMPSASDRRLSAMLEEGEMPPGPTTAEVLTDTDCTPDEQMISRCRNELRLADGRTIVLRHPHDMSRIPCLAPGEEVRVLPLGA